MMESLAPGANEYPASLVWVRMRFISTTLFLAILSVVNAAPLGSAVDAQADADLSLPVLGGLVPTVKQAVTDVKGTAGTAVTDVKGTVGTALTDVKGTLGHVLAPGTKGVVGPLLTDVQGTVDHALTHVKGTLDHTLDNAKTTVGHALTGVKNTLAPGGRLLGIL
ncbi:hypothetical protein EYR40_006045 [Pleurotus pulmonarius]|nr:hypothetical protein EYR36_005574 [Pleurotus pulmonarius]KAF4602828.1 hypothetical protein EYR40_006045 [Pleurotus pulmonarius]